MNKSIQITIPKAVVTSVFVSEKNNSQYLTLSSPAGEFKLTCPSGVHDFNRHLEDDRQDFQVEVQGRLFSNQQSLIVQRVIKPGLGKAS